MCPLVVDRDVAEEAPRPNLDLWTLPDLHVDALIPEERCSARGYPSARSHLKTDVPDQMEDAKDGSLSRRPGAQVQPHIADEDHDLLVGPSDGKGAFGHIPKESEHRRSSRRTPCGARAPDPEPGRRGCHRDYRHNEPKHGAGEEAHIGVHGRSVGPLASHVNSASILIDGTCAPDATGARGPRRSPRSRAPHRRGTPSRIARSRRRRSNRSPA
jgi:hypothetical protein